MNFKYNDSSDEFVLKNLSFCIKSGEYVAFAGTSGCGKSSILNLIERFYDCNEGDIYIDGKNIKDLDLGDIRRGIGLIS